jgi:hypothetical protein
VLTIPPTAIRQAISSTRVIVMDWMSSTGGAMPVRCLMRQKITASAIDTTRNSSPGPRATSRASHGA